MALRTKIDNVERYLTMNANVTALDDWETVVTIGGADDLPKYYAKNRVTREVSTDAELIHAIETKYRTRVNKGVYTPIVITWVSDDENGSDERQLRAIMESRTVEMINPGGTNGES